MDIELVKATNKLISLITEIGSLGIRRRDALKNITMTGSAREGAMVSRIFKPTKKNKKELNMEIECDLEFRMLCIPASHRSLVEDIPGKIGFLNLRCGYEMLNFANHVGWNTRNDVHEDLQMLKETTENGFLKTFRMKEVALKKTRMKEKDKTLELILAVAFGIDPDRLSLTSSKNDRLKSRIGNDISMLVDNDLKLNCSWDMEFVFQINWWPTVANEFIERDREWPDKEVISLLTKSGLIISKPSDNESDNCDTFELRYSFSHVESDLVTLRSYHQNLVYLIFKSMVYKWIKPISPDHLHSYMGKTVMFWTCEKYTSDHPLWNSDETRTLLALNHLFNELLKAFKKGFLPYYFIPEINIIPNLPVSITQKVIGQIELILDDLITYIPYTVKEVITTSKDLLGLIKSACHVLESIKHKDYGVLINRPELIPKLVKLFIEDFDMGTGNLNDLRTNHNDLPNEASEVSREIDLQNVNSDILRLNNDLRKVGKDTNKLFNDLKL